MYRLVRAGEFPMQRRLESSSIGWTESEIAEWILTGPHIAPSKSRRLVRTCGARA
ncbi:MAG: AlpA family phage regulatory protein [Gammaproteobacteria bacterium]